MRSMGIDRRRFLGLLAAGALPLAGRAGPPEGNAPLYLAARKRSGQYEAAVFDATGRDRHVVALPDRGHSFAIDAPRGRAVAFGRQPGFVAVAFALAGGNWPREPELA